MAYCRSLGHGSVRLLINSSGNTPAGSMVTLINGNLVPMALDEMVDPVTNRMPIRSVNLDSDTYRVSQAYMIRLDHADLDNVEMLAKLAEEAKMTTAEFEKRFRSAAV